GQEVTIRLKGGAKVDNANIIKTDIEASNGVIHVIDTVIMPK
ncbi:MAG: fasciclin domain-containing protein, partial [Aquificaceae bacterium]